MIICCMNPLLSRHSTLVGQRTFLGGCLSFLAFFMAMPRLPFHTLASMLLDRSRPSNSGASQGSCRGSHVYEINTWLWNFGRPQPRVGGLSVVKSEEIRRRSRSETSRRAWKTRQARKRAADEEEST